MPYGGGWIAFLACMLVLRLVLSFCLKTPASFAMLLGDSNYKWLRHAADPKPGGSYLTASTARTIDEGGGTTPISPDLAIGGPSWPQGRLQTTF